MHVEETGKAQRRVQLPPLRGSSELMMPFDPLPWERRRLDGLETAKNRLGYLRRVLPPDHHRHRYSIPGCASRDTDGSALRPTPPHGQLHATRPQA